MKIIYSDMNMLTNIDNDDIVFLCGPTPRSNDVKSWRLEALHILNEINFKGYIFVPERRNWIDNFNYSTQIEWEHEGMKLSKNLIFWVPRELNKMPGFTTNIEFGMYINDYSKNILYGRPKNTPKCDYMDYCYNKRIENLNQQKTFKIYEKLEEMLVYFKKNKNESVEHIKSLSKRFLKENNPIDYDKMKKHFDERTNKHIELVKLYWGKLKDNSIKILDHDQSKHNEPEYTPYIYITWKYRMDREKVPYEIPTNMKEKCHNATFHHVKNNKHHPEYWDNKSIDNPINYDNRDNPSDIVVDATRMPEIYLKEMCADWCAVSNERKSNPFDWAKLNINIRWIFTNEQEKIIYDTLKIMWEKL